MSDEQIDLSDRLETFEGAVILKDWMPSVRTGRVSRVIAGKRVDILKQDELVGFHVKGNESNWIAIVSGDTERVVILGCQVRAVVECPVGPELEQSCETYFVR